MTPHLKAIDAPKAEPSAQRHDRLVWRLTLLAIAVILLASSAGHYRLDFETIVRILASRIMPVERNWPEAAEVVLLQVRMPRVAGAFLVGAALAVSGAAYQGVFRNPLVSPFVLGVSSGAGVGAALAILLDASQFVIQASAFSVATFAVVAAAVLGGLYRTNRTLTLILSGIIVSSIFTALLGLLKYTADPEHKLPAIEYWLLGSLSGVRQPTLSMLVIVQGPALLIALALRWRLNILAMGEETARSMGARVRLEQLAQLGAATVLASSAVAVCGLVGWISLLAPHLGRQLVGADHDRLLPVCLLLGGALLLMADTMARASSSVEIPLGVVTSLVGAPVFALLLFRNRQSWA